MASSVDGVFMAIGTMYALVLAIEARGSGLAVVRAAATNTTAPHIADNFAAHCDFVEGRG